MKLVKTLAAAAVLAMSSFATQASTITVGGVTWNPAGNLDFTAETSESFYQGFNAVTNNLTGWGKITSVQGGTGYCSGCELVFKFDSLSANTISNEAVANSDLLGVKRPGEVNANFVKKVFEFNPGVVNIYVQAAGLFNGSYASINTATNWLNMDVIDFWATVLFKTSDTTLSNPLKGNSGASLKAKTDSALASQYFAQSPISSNSYMTVGFGSRFVGPNNPGANLNISADTVSVSAPSTLAVLGLGLIGLAGVARRKVKSN